MLEEGLSALMQLGDVRALGTQLSSVLPVSSRNGHRRGLEAFAHCVLTSSHMA